MSKINYSLACNEISEGEFYEMLTRKLNPVLFQIAEEHDYFQPRSEGRVLRGWINEYDNARIEVLWRYDFKTLEEALIDTLFNLRDALVSGKLDLKTFRRLLADIALLASAKQLPIAQSLLTLINDLQCSISIHPFQQTIDEELINVANMVKSFSNIESTGIVKVKVRLHTAGILPRVWKPLANYPVEVKITNLTPGNSITFTNVFITGQDGELVIPVPEYSIVEITTHDRVSSLQYTMRWVPEESEARIINSKRVEVVITDKDAEITLMVKKINAIKFIAIGLSMLALLATALWMMIKH